MRTLYDPDKSALYPDTKEVLHRLNSAGHDLWLVSRKEGQREDVVEKMEIAQFFVGVELTNNKRLEMMRIITATENEVVVVGDRVKGEILYGNEFKAETIWLRNGRFAEEMPETEMEKPDHVIKSLKEIEDVM